MPRAADRSRPLPVLADDALADDAALLDDGPSGNEHLDRLRGLARVLDDLVAVPGTRFRVGLDGLLGLVPGVGDSVTGAVSVYAMFTAYRLGAPPSVLVRMLLNIGIDLVVGSVPLVGDLFDFGWKSNRKNVRLVERYARAPEGVKASSQVVLALLAVIVVAGVVGIALLASWLLAWLLSVNIVPPSAR